MGGSFIFLFPAFLAANVDDVSLLEIPPVPLEPLGAPAEIAAPDDEATAAGLVWPDDRPVVAAANASWIVGCASTIYDGRVCIIMISFVY